MIRRLLLPLALLSPLPALADIVAVPASLDNTIYEESGSLANGAGDHFFAGNNGDGDSRRGLIQFDVASVLPPGSTVNAVSLRLYMSRSSAGFVTVNLHRVLEAWGEGSSHAAGQEGGGATATSGDATWTHRIWPGTTWSTSGGAFVGSSASQVISGIDFYTFSSAAMAADVQSWFNAPATNFGWILVGQEGTPSTSVRFDSHTNPFAPNRPTLIIDYHPPGANGACCFADGSCQSVADVAECTMLGGTYQGDGSNCTVPGCPQPVGACCLPNTTCVETTSANCFSLGGTYQGGGSQCATTNCPLVLPPFVDALPIPAIAQPLIGTPGGKATYVINLREFTQKLHRDLPPTRLWGYNGKFPGPTIEASSEQQVTVIWTSDLRDAQGALRQHHLLPVDLCPHGPATEGDNPRTVVHLHGGHVPADSDGYPEDTILPGESQTFRYPNWQEASTLWYHDHALGITRLNVYLGLAGFYIVRDAHEASLGLPGGEYEVPLVLMDRKFNPDGSLVYPAAWQDHFYGDTILVNGKVWPYMLVKRGKYRFRILNGSGSRFYTLSFPNNLPFQVIGSDGGLLPAPVTRTAITLSPGERMDVVVDFAGLIAGTQLVLENSAPAPFPNGMPQHDIPYVMQFLVAAAPGFTGALPATLRPVAPIPPSSAVVERDFTLAPAADPCSGNVWLINGHHWPHITEFPDLETNEIWRFINPSPNTHPMHMHLVFFQVLDRQPFQMVSGQVVPTGPAVPPPAEEAGWKDTVQAHPGEITRVIARFEDFSGKFPYHCHVLEHEDHDMMRQFQIDPPVGSFCLGDGGDNQGCTFCPCANTALPGTVGGCLNNRGRSAFLDPSGTPSVAADTLRFELFNASLSSFGILLSGAERAPANATNPCFGTDSGIVSALLNGLRCTVTDVRRHGTRASDAAGDIGTTNAGWGAPDGPAGGIIAHGSYVAGQTRHFQVFYREAPHGTCTAELNTSQGITVTFVP